MNSFFNSKIGKLYETDEGKKVIANYIKLIKENKILKRQYDLYAQIEEGVSSYIKESAKDEYVNEILNSISDIPKKELSEANDKLFWFLLNNEIITETENPWGTMKEGNVLTEGTEKEKWVLTKDIPVFRTLDYLLYEGKSKDLSLFIECKNAFAKNLKLKDNGINEQVTPESKIEDFNKKYAGKLTSEEMNLVRELIKTTKPQGVLVEYQKSITTSLNTLIKETEDVELKEKFLQLKEQILFEDSSDINKAMKLFEIRQVIDEIKNT